MQLSGRQGCNNCFYFVPTRETIPSDMSRKKQQQAMKHLLHTTDNILDMCGHTDTKILDMCGQTDTKIIDKCGQTDTKIIDIYVDKQEKN